MRCDGCYYWDYIDDVSDNETKMCYLAVEGYQGIEKANCYTEEIRKTKCSEE